MQFLSTTPATKSRLDKPLLGLSSANSPMNSPITLKHVNVDMLLSTPPTASSALSRHNTPAATLQQDALKSVATPDAANVSTPASHDSSTRTPGNNMMIANFFNSLLSRTGGATPSTPLGIRDTQGT
jgi:hypothetical protein